MSSTADAYGAPVQTWTDLKTVYGAIWPLRGQEYLANKQLETSVSYRIRIRYTTDVTPSHRLRLGDTTTFYDIKEVINPDLRNVYLELMCEESANA